MNSYYTFPSGKFILNIENDKKEMMWEQAQKICEMSIKFIIGKNMQTFILFKFIINAITIRIPIRDH